MKRLLVLVCALFFASCHAPRVEVWTGWQVNNVADFDGLRPEQKQRVIEFGREQLTTFKLRCREPGPDPTPFLTEEQEEEPRFSREEIEGIVSELLRSWNPDLGINELKYELHECINGNWVCKLPITLTHGGSPLIRSVNVGDVDIELEFDVTFVWSMGDC